MNVYPIDAKCESFGFDTITVNGHDPADLMRGFDRFLENQKNNTGKPTAIIAKTYMGHGVSFMNDKFEWHGKPPTKDQALAALEELAQML
jgi:transketolase